MLLSPHTILALFLVLIAGDPKMLPTQSKQKSIFFLYGILPLFHVLFEQMEGIRNLQKKLKFFYTPRWRKSPTGIPIGKKVILIAQYT